MVGALPSCRGLPNNNHKLDFGGRQAVLHINQLRTFVERESEGPPQTVAAIITSDDSDDQFSPPTLEWTDNADDKPRIGEHLTDTQRRQVEAIGPTRETRPVTYARPRHNALNAGRN